ncbi:related to Transcription initiation factor IIF subunit alpha [Saccharomycodes ludwigii]|uniref:Related to Transcription initiation factor IIF subunit alpha n=1 Tax=Saccharomycodes ludwigii TaxID=36035 RepID=A0A376BAU1_9ASCO|nr:related to Transcription initiation factor IIF subunit alpha [Saccharomycodes ludwigii]
MMSQQTTSTTNGKKTENIKKNSVSPFRASTASPFIKREQLRRGFFKARMKKLATTKSIGVKKEDPDLAAAKLLKKEDGLTVDGLVQHPSAKKKKAITTDANQFEEFPLRAVDASALNSVKTHIMKFQSKKKLEPVKDFHLPVRLHRKDTRNLQFQLTRAEIVQRQKEITEYKQKLLEEKGSKSIPTKYFNSNYTNKNNNDYKNKYNNNDNNNNNNNNNNNKNMGPPKLFNGTSVTNNNNNDNDNNTSKSTDHQNNTPDIGHGKNKDKDTPDTEHQHNPEEVGKVLYDGKEEPEEFEEGTTDPLADVAPDGGARVVKRGWPKRRTRKLKLLDENAKKLRFEEFYPWVLEDFDGYNTWVGSYEAGNSDQYVLLSVETDGSFTMIPADKVYRFTARNKYATLTIEEAEKRIDKNKTSVPRWLMKHLDDIGTTTTRYDRTMRKLRAVDRRTEEDGEDRGDNSDNELDFDEEFQDDEEAPIIDNNEEENKESEQRIKKEMLQANAMGLRDDNVELDDDNDDGELFGGKVKKEIDEEGKEVKKALKKTDLGALYDSDDDEANPYLSKSEDEDEEHEGDDNKDKSKSPAVKKESTDKDNAAVTDSNNSNNNKSETKKVKNKSPQKGKTKKSKKPIIAVKKSKNGVIVIKGDKTVLDKFPSGEWNPEVANKRKLEDIISNKDDKSPSKKRIKKPLENGIPGNTSMKPGMSQDSKISNVNTKGIVSSISGGNNVTGNNDNSNNSNSSNKEVSVSNNLLTEQDIIERVTSRKMTLKDLIRDLKKKVSMHPENKERMKNYVKRLVKLNNGYLELNTQHVSS